ncbi:MAG: FtsX-like permease family protein, partial [Chloroflexota bacterium]
MFKKPSYLTLMALRHSAKHPIQSLLLILGVALGVAMMIAIDLANSSASQAFSLSTDTIAGKATHQIVAAPGNVPASVYEELRVTQGRRNVAPVVTGPIAIVQADDLPLRLLGVDVFAEAPFRSYLRTDSGQGSNNDFLSMITALLVEPSTVILSEAVGNQLGLQTGDTFQIKAEGTQTTVKLAGLLKPSDDLSQRALNNLVLTDVSTAQELLGIVGYLTHIDLILTEDDDLQSILDMLPNTVRLQRANLRNETLDQLTAAFELNLTALSLLGVVVGIFLIYNTISFSVVQRRRILGILRCVGITRQQVFSLVLTEALILSAIGTVLGLGLGIFIGRGLVGLVTQTINDLFFSLTVQSVTLSSWSIYKGILAGIGAGLIAAFIPALEATTIPPVSTLKRSTVESRASSLIPLLAVGGLVMNGVGAGLLYLPTESLVISFGALFFIVIGMALLTPWLTKVLVLFVALCINPWADIISTMALRDILRTLSRTSVAIAALMISVAVIIGVSIMIASFRNTVVDWLDTILIADIFVSPADGQADIPPDFVAEVESYPGVESVELGRITTVLSPKLGQVQVNAFSEPSEEGGDFFWTNGTPAEAIAALKAGDIFVSEVFARQHNLDLNAPSQIQLQTANGLQTFQVSDIFYNYSPRGFILMSRDTLIRHWQDEDISNVALYLDANLPSDQIASELQAKFAGPYQLSIVSNRGLKESAIVIFDRTFT